MKKTITIFLLFISLNLFAQEKQKIVESDYTNSQVEMADNMRSNGKIYVVLGAVLIVLGGLFVYMVQTDRKLSRLEKEMD